MNQGTKMQFCWLLLHVWIALLYMQNCYGYDCNIGCDLDSNIDNGGIVCGSDGFEYPNECFAICQEVAIAKAGTCSSSNGSNKKPQNEKVATVSTGFISIEIMKRFKKEGYNFVRKVDYSKLNGKLQEPIYNPKTNDAAAAAAESKGWLRMTTDGYEYYSANAQQSIPISTSTTSPLIESSTGAVGTQLTMINNHYRSLKVIGDDSRVRIDNTSVIPYSFIGALGYSPDFAICSGTVIYKAAVLTAAHCVYDYEEKEWMPHSYFAPGRYTNNTFFYYDPYGRWAVDYMTIRKAFADTGSLSVDFSVSRMLKDSTGNFDYNIGEYVGHAGLISTSGFDDPQLDNCTITGYPGDKFDGKSMWTSGICPSGFISPNDAGFSDNTSTVALHDCDTFGGMSGSSFLGTDYLVRGVHTAALTVPWNAGPAFLVGNGIIDSIAAWATEEPCPTTCKPSTCTRLRIFQGVRVYKSSESRCVAKFL